MGPGRRGCHRRSRPWRRAVKAAGANSTRISQSVSPEHRTHHTRCFSGHPGERQQGNPDGSQEGESSQWAPTGDREGLPDLQALPAWESPGWWAGLGTRTLTLSRVWQTDLDWTGCLGMMSIWAPDFQPVQVETHVLGLGTTWVRISESHQFCFKKESPFPSWKSLRFAMLLPMLQHQVLRLCHKPLPQAVLN